MPSQMYHYALVNTHPPKYPITGILAMKVLATTKTILRRIRPTAIPIMTTPRGVNVEGGAVIADRPVKGRCWSTRGRNSRREGRFMWVGYPVITLPAILRINLNLLD